MASTPRPSLKRSREYTSPFAQPPAVPIRPVSRTFSKSSGGGGGAGGVVSAGGAGRGSLAAGAGGAPVPAKRMSAAEFFAGIVPGPGPSTSSGSAAAAALAAAAAAEQMTPAEQEFQEQMRALAEAKHQSISERFPKKPKPVKEKEPKPRKPRKLSKDILVKLYVKLIDKLKGETNFPPYTVGILKEEFDTEQLDILIHELLLAHPELEKYADQEIVREMKAQEEKSVERKTAFAEENGKCQALAAKIYSEGVRPLADKVFSEQKEPLWLPVTVQKMRMVEKEEKAKKAKKKEEEEGEEGEEEEGKEEKKMIIVAEPVGKPFTEIHLFRIVTLPTSKELKLSMLDLIPPTKGAPKGFESKSILALKRDMVSLESTAFLEGKRPNLVCKVRYHADFEPITEGKKEYYAASIDVDYTTLITRLGVAAGLKE